MTEPQIQFTLARRTFKWLTMEEAAGVLGWSPCS
jgi:hypothetical protein